MYATRNFCETVYARVFGVAESKFGNRISKFKMADPMWLIKSFNIYWISVKVSIYPTVFGFAES